MSVKSTGLMYVRPMYCMYVCGKCLLQPFWIWTLCAYYNYISRGYLLLTAVGPKEILTHFAIFLSPKQCHAMHRFTVRSGPISYHIIAHHIISYCLTLPFRCKQTMRSRIPDMNDKQLEKMVFLERCLHCLHVVGERIEVRI